MALTRLNASFDYRSQQGSVSYSFTVQADISGNVSVRNFRNQYGLIQDPNSALPLAVMQDIQLAIGQVEDIVAGSALTGTVTFNDSSVANATFPTATESTSYRVYVELPLNTTWAVTNKTTAGFTLELGTQYTGTIRYDVFV